MSGFWKVLVVVLSMILGGTLGNQYAISGQRTTWQQLDYFPFPVKNLLVVKPFGQELWVETTNDEIYEIDYPCSGTEACWERFDKAPSSPPDGDYVDDEVHQALVYNRSESVCDDTYDVIDPFPGELRTCITSTALAESLYIFALALNDKNELWVWDSPWVSPYTVMENMAGTICLGSVIGLIVGVLVIQIRIPARKT